MFGIANTNSLMRRSNDELLDEVFPGTQRKRALKPNESLISIEKAQTVLGYKPEFDWKGDTHWRARVAIKTDIVGDRRGAGGARARPITSSGSASRRGAVLSCSTRSPQAGGAWQYRWPSLTLSTVNRIHDLPGMSFAEAVPDATATASRRRSRCRAISRPMRRRFELPVLPAGQGAASSASAASGFRIETDRELFRRAASSMRPGTWETPLHSGLSGARAVQGPAAAHARLPDAPRNFAGQHVLVVGGGISAIQLLDEILERHDARPG